MKKTISLIIITLILFSTLTPALAANEKITKEPVKKDQIVHDMTKESYKSIQSADKSLNIQVKEKDTSKYTVKKDKYKISISKKESKKETTKTRLKIHKKEIEALGGFDGEKFGLIHIANDGTVTHDVVFMKDVLAGDYVETDIALSEIIISGFSGYYQTTVSDANLNEGIELNVPVDADVVDVSISDVPEQDINSTVIGIKWDASESSPELQWIDIDGNPITIPDSYFEAHPVFGNMWRCVINTTTGTITYGNNARGDGLDLTGASGNVMVQIPKFYVKFDNTSTERSWWISPYNLTGFELMPAFVQRGGNELDGLYVSAYDAAGYDDSGTFKLKSGTGLTPVTGGVSYPDLPDDRFDIDDAELYAGNIGSGYGCMNIWTMSAIRLLFYTEMGSLDSQSALGRGVVDLISGTGFVGVLCGADSADTNISTNGTGAGTGTDGETPIVYRGIENLWGNVWQFVIGYNAVDSEYRITKQDGTGTLSGDLAAGEYDVSSSAPIQTDGYQSGLDTDDTLALLFIPGAAVGSSSTYLCDYLYAHDAGETNILLFGGDWHSGSAAGVGYLYSPYVSSYSSRPVGARFEYLNDSTTLSENTATFNDTISTIVRVNETNYAYDDELTLTDVDSGYLEVFSSISGTSDVTVTYYFTEDTTLISESESDGEVSISINHTAGGNATGGYLEYDVGSSNFTYNLTLDSTNPNATAEYHNGTISVETGQTFAGVEYLYNFTLSKLTEFNYTVNWVSKSSTKAVLEYNSTNPAVEQDFYLWNMSASSTFDFKYSNGTVLMNSTSDSSGYLKFDDVTGLVNDTYTIETQAEKFPVSTFIISSFVAVVAGFFGLRFGNQRRKR
jgi:hypothetical protein